MPIGISSDVGGSDADLRAVTFKRMDGWESQRWTVSLHRISILLFGSLFLVAGQTDLGLRLM
jgi:hypothetical protein